MKPLYFGPSDASLFGIYHAPAEPEARDHGVVLCHSMGREQILGHRTFRQLAIHLSRAGHHVLRFDYFGCGDSAGEAEEGGPARWTADIATAVDELKEFADVNRVSLVGLRLGASLATAVGRQRTDVDGLVLWEPVINGSRFVEELLSRHGQWLRSDGQWVTRQAATQDPREVLGFPLTARMSEELAAIDLAELDRSAAPRVLILEQTVTADAQRLRDTWAKLGDVEYQHVQAPRFWAEGGMSNALVALDVIHAIATWMTHATP